MNSLPRRSLLAGGAGLAASAALLLQGVNKAHADADPAATVVVRWNAATKKWAPRPGGADFGVVFLSTNDPDATPPLDTRVQAGDVWRTHADAQHESIAQHPAVFSSGQFAAHQVPSAAA